MKALFVMRFLGQVGLGEGVIYVGGGVVAGADAGGGRYDGAYQVVQGRTRGTVRLAMNTPGGYLVTGQALAIGQVIPIEIDWPSEFWNGQPQRVTVGGRVVTVTLEKIRDLP